MRRIERHDLIERLQASQLRGAPFDLADLGKFGVSPQLAANYVTSRWLVRLAQEVYSFPGDTLDEHRTIQFLQAKIAGLHFGGRSALSFYGVRHNLASRKLLVLWGDERSQLPEWLLSRFPARHASARLYTWPEKMLARKTLITPPGAAAGAAVSSPERALPERLYDVGTHEDIEEAHHLFEGMRNLRVDQMGRLIGCRTSVKAVRLFLTWARETELMNVDALVERYPLPAGSGKD